MSGNNSKCSLPIIPTVHTMHTIPTVPTNTGTTHYYDVKNYGLS